MIYLNQFFDWMTRASTARMLVHPKAFCLVMERRKISNGSAGIAYLSIESV